MFKNIFRIQSDWKVPETEQAVPLPIHKYIIKFLISNQTKEEENMVTTKPRSSPQSQRREYMETDTCPFLIKE